jgi:hypothetical protein
MLRWLWRIQHNPASYVSPAEAERRENAGISQDPLAYSNYAGSPAALLSTSGRVYDRSFWLGFQH